MKLFTYRHYAATLCIVLLAGCGGSDDSSSGGDSNAFTVDTRDYFLAPATVTYTMTDFEYVDGTLDFEESYTLTEQVDGSTVTLLESGVETETAEVTADGLVFTSIVDNTTNSIPAQISVGETLTTFDETNSLGSNVTTVVTVTALLDSFAVSTPDQTFQSFNDVLQLDLETTITYENDPTVVDRAILYYARDVGSIGSYDRDCFDVDRFLQDDATECDSVIEYYTVRMN